MSEAMRWIPCLERMPELIPGEGYSENVLVFGEWYDEPFIAYRGEEPTRWIVLDDKYGQYSHITHWMPLPSPPGDAGEPRP